MKRTILTVACLAAFAGSASASVPATADAATADIVSLFAANGTATWLPSTVATATPAGPQALLQLASGGGNSGSGGGGDDDSGGDDDNSGSDDDDDDDDDHGGGGGHGADDNGSDDDVSGSGRRRPRIPGGSGCDDPGDVQEHPECQG